MVVTFAKAISAALYIGGLFSVAQAFTATDTRLHLQSTQLYNVPPPGTDSDPLTIKKASNREAPPQSFYQLQINSARAAELAIRDGHKLIEVEVSSILDFVYV